MSATTQMQVAEQVKNKIFFADSTPRKVALALGWKANFLYRRLHSEVSFSIDELEAIAGVIGVTVADFIPAVVPVKIVRPLELSRVGEDKCLYLSHPAPTSLDACAVAA